MTQLDENINTTIANAVNAKVEASVLAALSGDELMGRYVTAALTQQLEVNKPEGYGKHKVQFLHHVISKMIQDATRDALARMIEEERPAIEAAVREALRANITGIASGLVDGLANSQRVSYSAKVQLDLNRE